jgi:type VI secretion system protein ImpB
VPDDKNATSKDRVNIVYKTHGDSQEKELPFKLLILGDFTGKEDPDPFSGRKPVRVNNGNFEKVFAGLNPQLELSISEDPFGGDDAKTMPVNLDLKSLKDMEPASISENVGPIKKISLLRRKLMTARRTLAANPEMLDDLRKILADPETRALLEKELDAQPKNASGEKND